MPGLDPAPLEVLTAGGQDRGLCAQWGPRLWEVNSLARGHWGSPVPAPVCSFQQVAAAHNLGTAGTYQVPSGAHQLVGGEGEGLVAQVCIKHLLEDGPAVSENRVGQSVSQPTLAGTPGCVLRARRDWGQSGEQDQSLCSWGTDSRPGANEGTAGRTHTKQAEKAIMKEQATRWRPDPQARSQGLLPRVGEQRLGR